MLKKCIVFYKILCQVKLRFPNKTIFSLTIYFNDIEINNLLGSQSSVDAIGVVYYQITSLAPEYFF